MSTQAAMPDNCPVQWTGRLAILALPQRVGDSNVGPIREELLRVINRGAPSDPASDEPRTLRSTAARKKGPK